MNNFKLIQEHFSQLHCAYCDCFFATDGVELLREEDDYWVVRVSCSACQQPAGVAIVGIEYEESAAARAEGPPAPPVKPLTDLTVKDRKRLSKFATITDDDVLDAHSFIQELGADWTRHLPKRFQKKAE
ncbi:MAG: hypothetical protein H7338_20035 [Candidatus Sericytochromatia bacterium]|nr:hypothetical protein [Candidatus Sericytochromatia bacterium]